MSNADFLAQLWLLGEIVVGAWVVAFAFSIVVALVWGDRRTAIEALVEIAVVAIGYYLAGWLGLFAGLVVVLLATPLSPRVAFPPATTPGPSGD